MAALPASPAAAQNPKEKQNNGRATVEVLEPDGSAVRGELAVTFNPSSLKYQIQSSESGGKGKGTTATQWQGGTATLSVELLFDTADAGTDVRELTKPFQAFVLAPGGSTPNPPKGKGAKASKGGKNSSKSSQPFLIRFSYGGLIVTGVVTSLAEDLDLFGPDGVAWRAKLSLTIKEHDPRLSSGDKKEQKQAPPAAAHAPSAPQTPPNNPGANREPDRSASPLEGETAPDFAQRMGHNPKSWRDALPDIVDPQRLAAGIPLPFRSAAAALSSAAALGRTLANGVSAGLTVGFGTAGSGSSTTSRATTTDPATAGEQGGVRAALRNVDAKANSDALERELASFQGVPRTSEPAMAAGGRNRSSTSMRTATPAGNADARQYGRGIPLRPRVGVPASMTSTVSRVQNAGSALTQSSTRCSCRSGQNPAACRCGSTGGRR